jgi:hypothetical protein
MARIKLAATFSDRKGGSTMGEIWPDARMWHSLMAHAEQIAATVSSLSPEDLAVAMCDREGHWLGCFVVARDDPASQAQAHQEFSFYFPRSCDTPRKVIRFIQSHWRADGV